MKKGRTLRYILLYVLVFFLTLSVFSTNWAVNKFAFLSFDETMFQLTSPIKSAESSILTSFLTDSFLFAVICSIIVFFVLCLIINYLSCKKLDFEIKLWRKNLKFSIKTSILKVLLGLIIFLSTIGIVYSCLDRIGFISYIYDQTHESLFIEKNYVDPDKVSLTFPEKKKNLIYIYVESLESTYFSKDLGGETKINVLEPITDITSSNISFSDTDKFGGAMTVPGTTWTTSAMIAQTAGLPLKVSARFVNDNRVSTMMTGTTTLGDILYENGYKQMYMIGSDKDFGNRGVYFEKHGNYEIYDYNTAKEKDKIADDYYVWWGYEDSKLFEYAKEEITDLASGDQPFNFTMLTANTHFTDGYLEANCPTNYGNAYFNSVHCSAGQLEEFITWITKQPFYKDTTIVMTGDHISMQGDLYPEDTKRRIYNLFINSSTKDGKFTNREFCTMDLFPTTLASMGVEIEGDRLGLGTNLFSNKKTLIEKVGYDKFNEEISSYSSYYMKHLLNE